jgi:hypothetical protein
MKASAKRERPTRLSEEELRKSRAGTLGRFPSEDLYESEQEDASTHKAQGLKRDELSSTEHEKSSE